MSIQVHSETMKRRPLVDKPTVSWAAYVPHSIKSTERQMAWGAIDRALRSM